MTGLVMRVEMIGSMLAYQRREITMHGIFMRAMRLELDGDVGNPKVRRDTGTDVLEQFVGQYALVIMHQHVAGQHDQERFNGSAMQIVNNFNTKNSDDGGGKIRGADARLIRFEQHVQ